MDWDIEVIGLIAAFLTTVGFVPQVYKSVKTKNVAGVSLTMYLVLFIGLLFWLTYGFLIDSFAIKLANIVSGFLVFTIILLRIIYKDKE
ncbi:MAG: SemiSWEET transporter [Bacteroidota bacterium]